MQPEKTDNSRKGTTPQIGEITIANISKIMPFGAYCKLPEYNNMEVFLPIKEVSSGWIKNIHEFIHEGQKIVCKVTYYDKERQTIDISLKKVTTQESKTKLDTYNLEKRLSALFLRAIRLAGLDSQKTELVQKAEAEFPSYTILVRNAAAAGKEFEQSTFPKKLKEGLLKLIETSQKRKRYIVSYIMTLSTFNTMSGATELRSIISAIKGTGVDVDYISAPKYHLAAEGANYVEAEGKIKDAVETAKSILKKGEFEIEKEKLKKEKEDILSTL